MIARNSLDFNAFREALGKGDPVVQGRIERQSGVPRRRSFGRGVVCGGGGGAVGDDSEDEVYMVPWTKKDKKNWEEFTSFGQKTRSTDTHRLGQVCAPFSNTVLHMVTLSSLF